MVNKRGQGLSTGAIVLIILAVLVLVVIVLAFFLGADKINPFINKSNNIKEIQDQCTFACNTGDTFGYCNTQREVKLGSDDILGNLADGDRRTCNQLEGEDSTIFETCSKIACSDEGSANDAGGDTGEGESGTEDAGEGEA